MKSKLRIAVVLLLMSFVLISVLAGCNLFKNKKPSVNIPQGGDITQGGDTTQNGSSELSFTMVYKAAQDLGYTGTLEELIEAFKGDSAYQIAVANGYTGSEAEWLLSLKGATGATGADGKTPFIGENGNWWIGEIDCGVTATGKDGNGILRIEHSTNAENPEILNVTVYFTNETTTSFSIKNGEKGENGEKGDSGNGILKIEKTDTAGLTDTYTITFTDGTTTEFVVANGATGNGIDRIEKTETNGKVDTYTIYYTNGDTFEFTMTNGTDGKDGKTGATGATGNGIESIEKTDTDGNKDIYTITFTDGNTTTFTVTNAPIQEDVTVIFDAVDGVIPDTYTALTLEDLGNGKYKVVLPANTPITALPIPEKTECDFVGWFTGETVNDGQWFNYFAVKADMTLYASWHHKYLKYELNDDWVSYSVTGLITTVNTDIVIPSTFAGKPVTGIGKAAFKDRRNLTSIEIPDSVTSIGNEAFYNCSSLTAVYITDIAKWCGISFGTVLANPLYYARNLYLNGELVTDLVIPDSVTSIGEQAFFGCSSLTSVVIGDGVESIGSYAFEGCSSITSIEILDSVESIGSGAFFGCNNLTSVVIGDSVENIGERAFFRCYKLVEVYNKSSLNITKGSSDYGYVGYYAKEIYTEEYESKISIDENGYIIYTDGESKVLMGYTGQETERTLPENITEIYQYAFYDYNNLTGVVIGDSVTSVVIGDSVTSIGEYAFYYCSSLTSINYCGTVSEWESISKVSNWNDYTGEYTVYCTDGEIAKDGTVTYY